VRFAEGLDAVRCFLSLNGSIIDPVPCRGAVEAMLGEAVACLDGSGGRQKAAVDALAHTGLRENLLVASADEPGNPNGVVCVTCDFFRTAFYPPTDASGTFAPRSTFMSARSTRRPENEIGGRAGAMQRLVRLLSPRGRAAPAGAPTNDIQTRASDGPAAAAATSPFQRVCVRLSEAAAEVRTVRPVVLSMAAADMDAGDPAAYWGVFALAVNATTFMLPLPSPSELIVAVAMRDRVTVPEAERRLGLRPSAAAAAGASGSDSAASPGRQRKLEDAAASPSRSSTWACVPGPWVLCLQALRRHATEPNRLLYSVDRAETALSLVAGARPRLPAGPSPLVAAVEAILVALRESPMLTLTLFVTACFMLAASLFVLFASSPAISGRNARG
jgi:hypothetical protein